MKKLLYIFYGLLLCSSCSNLLDVQPENSVTYKNFFQDEKDVNSVYVQMYAKLRDVYYNYYTMQPLDKIGLRYDVSNASNYEYVEELKALLVNAFKETMISWTDYYNVIFQANLILDNMYRANLSKDREDFYRGHVYFVKGLMYYEIARRWGNAPITKNSESGETLARSEASVVLDTAASNALRAYNLLAKCGESQDVNGKVVGKYYAHKGAAAALLANIYAWKGGLFNDMNAYKEAEKYCSLIIDQKVGVFTLEGTPEDVCLHKEMSCESIFELLNNPKDFGSGSTAGRFHTGINFHSGANDWPGNTGGYPLNPNSSIIDNKDKNLYLLKNETVKAIWGEEDLRREAYFWKFDEMCEESTNVTGGYAYPFFWREVYVDYEGYMENVAGNRIFWRLAEIYLLRAEARCRAGLAGAEDDLNEVRKRAHANAYPSANDTEDLQMTIFREREKELFFDGERYFDIIRNGYWKLPEMISPEYAKLTDKDIEGGALYLPIPDTEMKRNNKMRRNPYWLAKW